MRSALRAIAVLAAIASQAHAGTLRGRVVDAATGRAVAGATVSAGGAETTTDDDGRYRLDGVSGRLEIVVIADGYDPALASTRAGRTVELRLVATTGEVIEVTGRAPVEPAPETYRLTGEEVRTLPGSGNDALKGLQTLPGVARLPFGLGGLVLRGANPRDSKVYLDGIPVPILFHFGGFASFYPSALLDRIDLEPGGFGAPWGRAQGGLALLTGRTGRRDRWRIESEVSLIDAQVRGEGPAPAGGAWTVGLRRSYVDAVLGAVLHGDRALTILPRYWDGQVRYDRGALTAMLFFSDDELRFASPGADINDGGDDQLEYTSGFVRAGLRWRHGPLTVTPWIGYGRFGLDTK